MIKLSTPTEPVKTPFKLLLIGPPGSRKSTLLLQFPGVYVEDCDKNLRGPEEYLRKNGYPQLSYGFNPVRYTDSGEMRPIEDCYNSLCDDLKRMVSCKKDYEQFKVIGVDSLSHVNEFIIRHVLHLQGKTKKVGEMEPRDWTPFKSYAYQLLVARLEEPNKHVICTAHEIKLTESDPSNMMVQKVLGYEPFFQGKVGDTIGAFFSDVWRMEVRLAPGDKTETWVQTVRHPKCEHLKNSLGLPPELNITKGFPVLEPYFKAKGYFV